MQWHSDQSTRIIPQLMPKTPAQFSLYRLAALFVLAMALTVSGCNRDKKKEDTRSAEEIYEDASKALNAKNYPRAIELYRQLNTRYPFGRHAEQAQLDMAYAMHKGRQPEQAITTLDRFIRTYPTHPNVDYAWYLKGLVHYDDAMGLIRRLFPEQATDRDQESARQAFLDFQELVRRFPESRYVADARQRMVFLRNILAEYEVAVAKYYLRRGANIAALNRMRYVVENYSGAPATIDALELMVQCYEALDMPELAADTRRVLEYNYAEMMTEEERRGFFSRLWPFN